MQKTFFESLQNDKKPPKKPVKKSRKAGRKTKQQQKSIVFKNDAEASEYCGVSRQAVSRSVSCGKLRQQPDGAFFKEDLDDWIARRRGQKKDKKTKDADTKLKEIRTKILETKHKQQLGELMKREDVVRAFTDRAYELARNLDNYEIRLADRLAAKFRVPKAELKKILREEMNETKKMFMRPIPFET